MDIKFRKIFIRSALALLTITIAGLFLYLGIVPSGHIAYTLSLDHAKENYFVNKLTPADRIGSSTLSGLKIIGEPVYFTLRTPRRFRQAKLSLTYKNESNMPLIEAGVLTDKVVWRYDLQPLENSILDRLAQKWTTFREGSVMLMQKEKKYDNLGNFLKNLPPRDEIALYNYELTQEYLLPGYIATDKNLKITYPLRGPFQFYTYIDKEKLDYKFDIIDLNQNNDADSVVIDLYYSGRLVASYSLPDDGIAQDSGEVKSARTLAVAVNNLPVGVYKIEVRANNDIIVKAITTEQSKLSFINKIWLGDTGEKNDGQIILFTDSSLLQAQTANPAKLQTIRTDRGKLELEETYRQYTLPLSSTSTKIILLKNDVIIAGNANFAFSPEALFNPDFAQVDARFDPDKSGIKYILADYEAPASIYGWKTASAVFNLENAYRDIKPHLLGEPSKYSFMLSIPGLLSSDKKDDYVEVKEIRIELEGTGLWEKILKM